MAIPKKIDRYEIIGELGRGGMATVYRAYDPRFQREVAIKVLPPHFLHDETFSDRFAIEAQMIAALEHSAIVPVYDFGGLDRQPFLVMRLLKGGSLRDRLTATGALPLAEIARIFNKLAPGLDKAHERGIIHRDIKPDNILFDEDGQPYLADFGIARLAEGTRTMALIGTPAYMSPEQFDVKKTLDGRSDVYALGVILFEMMTGRQPFQGDTAGVMRQHILEPVPDVVALQPGLPPASRGLIERAMAKNSHVRFASAGDLAAAVTDLAAGRLPTWEQTVIDAPVTEVIAPAFAQMPTPGTSGGAPMMAVPAAAGSTGAPALPSPARRRRLPWLLAAGGVVVIMIICIVGGVLIVPGLLNPEEGATTIAGGVTPEPRATASATRRAGATAAAQATRTRAADPPAPTPIPAAPGDYLERAFAGEFAGAVVTSHGAFDGADMAHFALVLTELEAATGITVIYEPLDDYEAAIRAAVAGGNPPDIANISQPGLLADLAENGAVINLDEHISRDFMLRHYNPSWLDIATVPGPDGPMLAGIWQRASVKSLVWYPGENLEFIGLQVPETWPQMMDLTIALADSGQPPWCMGMASGAATGWVATDWVEDIMLRTAPLAAYDAWVRGDLPFNSPEVRRAVEIMSDIWQNDAFIYGGTSAILDVSFTEAASPMFDFPPNCWLHRQASFIPSFFPEDAVAGVDYDFFYLPPIDPEYGRPLLVAGDMWAAFSDRPAVMAVMAYFATGESMRPWMEAGGVVAPHLTADLGWYGSDFDRRMAELIQRADGIRFDASDQMPSRVGAGAFWTAMSAYFGGEIDLDTALREIDAAWP